MTHHIRCSKSTHPNPSYATESEPSYIYQQGLGNLKIILFRKYSYNYHSKGHLNAPQSQMRKATHCQENRKYVLQYTDKIN